MSIHSVNVSEVRTIEHEGSLVQTGIFKRPVDATNAIEPQNLDGDAQADLRHHGGPDKAVYAFSADEYGYWRDELDRDSLTPGFFGENLTIDGLDEARLAIGDRFRAGTALLEVTQPRVPCFKLGIAAGDTDLPRRFLKHARPGIYLRVIEPGSVSANDDFEPVAIRGVTAGDPHSIVTLYRAVHDLELPSADRLDVIAHNLDVPELSVEWRHMLLRVKEILIRQAI